MMKEDPKKIGGYVTMKKTLSILLALVMVIGVFPSFADDAEEMRTPEKALEELIDYGVIKGDGYGNYDEEGQLTRAQSLVILSQLLGEADKVADMDITEDVYDDVKADAWYSKVVKWAKDQNFTKGVGNNKFNPEGQVSLKEFLAFQLRALGYAEGTTEDYARTMQDAKNKDLLNGLDFDAEDTKLIRNNAFVIMRNTLDTPVKGGKALKFELGLETEVLPEEFSVIEVRDNGLAVIEVDFSEAVLEDTVKNIRILDNDRNSVSFDKYFKNDGKTAILKLSAPAKQNDMMKVIVENVRADRTRDKAEKFEKELKMLDVTRPEVTNIEVQNPKTLVLTVSEPMKEQTSSYAWIDEIKINGKKAYAKINNNYDGTLDVILFKAMAIGENEIVVDGLEDFADLPCAEYTQTVDVVADNEAPKIVEAKMITTKKIKVIFDENVENSGSFKVDGNNILSGGIDQDDNDKKIFELTLPTGKQLGLGAVVDVKVEYKGQKDVMGNKVNSWDTFNFRVEDDTEIPTVEFEGFDEDDSTIVLVKFSQSMANNKGKWTLKDNGGSTIQSKTFDGSTTAKSVQFQKHSDDTIAEFKITELEGENPENYKLVLEDFEDGSVRHNKLPKTVLEFVGKDTKTPYTIGRIPSNLTNGGQLAYTFKKEPKNDYYLYKFTVVFNEEMDEDTLKNEKNYVVGGKRLDLIDHDVDIDVLEDGLKSEIKIEVKDDVTNYNNYYTVGTTLTLRGLKDKGGKLLGYKDTSGNIQTADEVTLYGQLESTMTAPALDTPASKVKVFREGDELRIKFIYNEDVKLENGNKFKMNGGASLAYIGDPNKYDDELEFVIEGADIEDDLSAWEDAASGAPAPAYTIEENAVKNARGKANGVEAHTLVGTNDDIAARIALDADDDEKVMIDAGNDQLIQIEFTEQITNINDLVVKEGGTLLGATAAVNGANNKIVDITMPTMENGKTYKIEIFVRDGHNVNSKSIKTEITASDLISSGDKWNQMKPTDHIKLKNGTANEVVVNGTTGEYNLLTGTVVPAAIDATTDKNVVLEMGTLPTGVVASYKVMPIGGAYGGYNTIATGGTTADLNINPNGVQMGTAKIMIKLEKGAKVVEKEFTINVADQVAPTATVSFVSTGEIKVTFSEPVQGFDAANSMSGFSVAGAGNLTSVAIDGANTVVTLTASGNDFQSGTTTVSYDHSVVQIKDMHNNNLADFGPTVAN